MSASGLLARSEGSRSSVSAAPPMAVPQPRSAHVLRRNVCRLATAAIAFSLAATVMMLFNALAVNPTSPAGGAVRICSPRCTSG